MRILSMLNLRTRALIATSGILLLALGANMFITLYSAGITYQDALLSKVTGMAELIRSDIERALGAGTPQEMSDIERKLGNFTRLDENITFAFVMDMSGKVLAAHDHAAAFGLPQNERVKQVLTRAAESRDAFSEENSPLQSGSSEMIFPLFNREKQAAGVLRIGMRSDVIRTRLHYPFVLSLAVALISLFITSGLVYLAVSRGITDPIRTMSETAGRIAAGDLTSKIPLSGQTEVTALGAAINTMSSNFREMLSKLKLTISSLGDAVHATGTATQKVSRGALVQQEATEQSASTVSEMVASIRGVAENAEAMSNSATDASSAVTEMAASIGEIAESAGGLSSLVQETAASIQEMLASTRQVSENTEALSASAEQTSASLTEMSASVKEVEQSARESSRLAQDVSKAASERGLIAAQEAINGMERIKTAVEATADIIHRLGKSSQEIGQILKVIDEVTDQTGLLALNAAILAAQAGEHGKGFSVIAEEIKELAERTATSTKEIADLIATVQKDTGESVRAMGKGLQAVTEGAELVSVTKDVLEQVVEGSRQSSNTAVSIERTTSEQARGIGQITEAVITITDQIESIARAMKEQRRGSEQMTNAAEKMREIARRVQYATQEQTSGSKQIARAVDSVTTQASQIARSTSEQRNGVDQINTAVSSIQKITQQVVDVSIEIDIAMQSLKERADALRTELGNFVL